MAKGPSGRLLTPKKEADKMDAVTKDRIRKCVQDYIKAQKDPVLTRKVEDMVMKELAPEIQHIVMGISLVKDIDPSKHFASVCTAIQTLVMAGRLVIKTPIKPK